MALMYLFPLSPLQQATFPHVLESSGIPPVPNPTLESEVVQSFCSLLRIPILALEGLLSHTTRRASRGHEAARSEKLLRLLSDRAQTLHKDLNFINVLKIVTEWRKIQTSELYIFKTDRAFSIISSHFTLSQ